MKIRNRFSCGKEARTKEERQKWGILSFLSLLFLSLLGRMNVWINRSWKYMLVTLFCINTEYSVSHLKSGEHKEKGKKEKQRKEKRG